MYRKRGKMTITREWLNEHKACDKGMDWFFSVFPESGMEITPDNIKKFDEYEDYLAWLLAQEIEVTKELLDHGANVHADDDWAIVCAAAHGRTKLCQLLLEYGASVHAHHDCALEFAFECGYFETAALLKKWMEKK